MTTKYFINYNYRYIRNGEIYTWDTMTFNSVVGLYDVAQLLKNKGMKLHIARVDTLKNNNPKIYNCFIENKLVDSATSIYDIIKIFGKKNATRLIND